MEVLTGLIVIIIFAMYVCVISSHCTSHTYICYISIISQWSWGGWIKIKHLTNYKWQAKRKNKEPWPSSLYKTAVPWGWIAYNWLPEPSFRAQKVIEVLAGNPGDAFENLDLASHSCNRLLKCDRCGTP